MDRDDRGKRKEKKQKRGVRNTRKGKENEAQQKACRAKLCLHCWEGSSGHSSLSGSLWEIKKKEASILSIWDPLDVF